MTTVAEVLLRRHDDDSGGLRSADLEGSSWTWREVVQESAVRAAVLRALRRDGGRPGSSASSEGATSGPANPGGPFHVGVLLENVPEYVFLLGAAALEGATIVGINPTRRGGQLAEDIRHTDCQLIVTDRRQVALLDGLDLGVGLGVGVGSGSDRVLVVEDEPWGSLLGQHAGAPPPPPERLPGPEALYILIFTSGSSGAPKAVRATQGRIAAMANMGFAASDVLYCSMPLFHGNALASNLLPAMGAGATVVLRRRFSASGFLPDVRRHGVTYFNSVGRALSYILATPASAADRDHSVRFALAPESSARDIAEFEARFGITVFEGYGSSEGAIRLLPVRDRRPGALGRPEASVDVAVVDPSTGRDCPAARLDDQGRLLNGEEAIGELVRRDAAAATTFEGYYENPEATAERSRNGWFWSGDLAYRDDDGVFYFAGRTIDWLRVDGENFAAAPVERIIARHPDVGAVAVYSVPDPRTGDQVMTTIELRDGAVFDPAEFTEFLAAQDDLGTKWRPRFIRVTRALPTTATNKIAKPALRTEAWLTDDPVWWLPTRDTPYTRLTPDATADLASQFESHGRHHLLPSPTGPPSRPQPPR